MTNGSESRHRNVDHLSVKISLGHCPLYQDVDHFSVKILRIQHAELIKNVSLVGIRNDDHLNVKFVCYVRRAESVGSLRCENLEASTFFRTLHEYDFYL